MIKLTEKYYIDSDELNYMLKEKRIITKKDSKNFGKENYSVIAYFNNLSSLKKFIVEREIKADINVLSNMNKIIELIDSLNK